MTARQLRVCIITPGHVASTPRVVKEADALIDAGYSVHVIAGDVAQFVRPLDAGVLARARWRGELVKLGSPAGRLLRRARQRVAQRSAEAGIAGPTIAAWAHDVTTGKLTEAAKAHVADLYIAHYDAALPAAAGAARLHRARYAFDAEDFHPGDHPHAPEHEASRKVIDVIERTFLPGCAYVTAASPGIADAYARVYGIPRPKVVLNVFPREHAPASPIPSGTVLPRPSVYWFSQTIGPDRGLEGAVRAIGLANSKPHLFIRGTPATGFLSRLHALALEAAAADRIHILPPEPPHEMVRIASEFDVGLVAETGRTENRRIALTNKQFTYMLAGVPVLMSDIEAHRRFATEAGSVVRLFSKDNPTSLANAMDELFEDPVALATVRAAAFRLGHERFNWDVEQQILLDCVKRAVVPCRDGSR